MNALYVTVSIPLLLVLAGFNHAHGLTTFGKTSQTQQQQQAHEQKRACMVQFNCTLIKGTSCIDQVCRCGNNELPVNGKCKDNIKKGPNHVCGSTDECIENAECILAKDRNKTAVFDPTTKICVCQEGFEDTRGGTCGGESNFLVLPGLVMIIVSLSTTLY